MVAVFRPVQENDLEAIYQLALQAGFGITTLPKDREELHLRIERSLNSFAKTVDTPFDENYFFVLEDLASNSIVGTSAIEAAVGHKLPFYGYRVSRIFNICHSLGIRVEYDVLTLNNDFQGMTEIGTLYLHENSRCNRNGLLLSLARFLFIGCERERFSKKVIAEMRGVSDENGLSPFWECFGRHFFKMSFVEADRLSVLTDKQFISDLLPHHPVHVNLLDPKAQQAIGKPHNSTKPAMKILQREGFNYNYYVDIFDAGPAIQAETDAIRTVKQQQYLPVKKIVNQLDDGNDYFLANNRLDFRAIKHKAKIEFQSVVITEEAARILDVVTGDKVQVINFK